MRTLPSKIVLIMLLLSGSCFSSASEATEFSFKNRQISMGYADKNFISDDFPRPPTPLFWKSGSTDGGALLLYKQLLWHSQEYFSLYWGGSIGRYQWYGEPNYTISAFLEIRWWIFHTTYVNPYVLYSVAGPTVMSRTQFGHKSLGEVFTFQDYLGLGVQLGETQTFNVDLKMVHYSNGNLFSRNPGFDSPLMLTLGYSF